MYTCTYTYHMTYYNFILCYSNVAIISPVGALMARDLLAFTWVALAG